MVTQTQENRKTTKREYQAERIRRYLRAYWKYSDRQIATALDSTHPTIAKYRRQLEEEGEILPRIDETFQSTGARYCEVVTSAIQSPPENDKLYDPVDPDSPEFLSLVNDVKKNGIINPLGVSRDGWVFDGNRRLAAATHLELDKVPISIRPDVSRGDDPDGFLRLLRSCNQQRNKTTAEQTREAVVDANPKSWQYLADYRRSVSEVNGAEIFHLVGSRKRSAIVQKRGLADAIIRTVTERYKKHGATNDRKIFYLLLNIPGLLRNDVTKTPYRNNDESYQDVTDLLTRLRLDGSIPFNAIMDETRPVIVWDTHKSVGSFVSEQLEDFLCGYSRDLLQSQTNWYELLVEKNTVAHDLKNLAYRYTIPMTSGRGYSSLPPRKGMVDRFRKSGKEKLVVIAVSDFDPEGQDIPNSFGLSLRDDFGIDPDRLVVVKAALTYRQTKELDLHEGQLSEKTEGARYNQFVKAYGERVWELEALETDLLEQLVDHTIQSVIDLESFEDEVDTLVRERGELSVQRRNAMAALSECLGDGDDEY